MALGNSPAAAAAAARERAEKARGEKRLKNGRNFLKKEEEMPNKKVLYFNLS